MLFQSDFIRLKIHTGSLACLTRVGYRTWISTADYDKGTCQKIHCLHKNSIKIWTLLEPHDTRGAVYKAKTSIYF